jgi:hypothetical protein
VPPLGDGPERRGVEVVELVAALPAGPHQGGLLEDGEVLGDGLARGAEPVPAGQPAAELEQRLATPFLQFVEDGPPGRVRQGLEHVAAHPLSIGKCTLA